MAKEILGLKIGATRLAGARVSINGSARLLQLAAAPLANTMQLVDLSVSAGGDGSIGWQSDPVDADYNMAQGGAALFGYTRPAPTPTTQAPATTVAPTTVPPAAAPPAAPVVVNPTYTG